MFKNQNIILLILFVSIFSFCTFENPRSIQAFDTTCPNVYVCYEQVGSVCYLYGEFCLPDDECTGINEEWRLYYGTSENPRENYITLYEEQLCETGCDAWLAFGTIPCNTLYWGLWCSSDLEAYDSGSLSLCD